MLTCRRGSSRRQRNYQGEGGRGGEEEEEEEEEEESGEPVSLLGLFFILFSRNRQIPGPPICSCPFDKHELN
jgi:hypothetical protein